MSEHPVSSPVATGGAGNVFEQHVCAHWLALLLARAIPPILTDSAVARVHFQTGHLGWSTDDVVVEAETSPSLTRKLACQVKRTFTVSASDDECIGAIRGFWEDHKKAHLFDQTRDRLVLVVLRGTDSLLVLVFTRNRVILDVLPAA